MQLTKINKQNRRWPKNDTSNTPHNNIRNQHNIKNQITNNTINNTINNTANNMLNNTWVNIIKTPPPIPVSNSISNSNSNSNSNLTGNDKQLCNKFNLWSHSITNKDWDISSYDKLLMIDNVSTFWKVFNNLHKLGYRIKHFYLMKENIDPLWEHQDNRNGGVCSFRVDIGSALSVFEHLCSMLVTNSICENPEDVSDINGVSISPKNSWAIIKVWNKDCNNDLTQKLNKSILTKYADVSIKYKSNAPEY